MTSIEWLENEFKKSIHYYRLIEDIESKSTIVQSNIFEQAKEMYKQEQDNMSAQRYMDGYNKSKINADKEICKFAEFVASYGDKNRNVNGEMLHAKSKYDGAERTIDLLEKFRNK